MSDYELEHLLYLLKALADKSRLRVLNQLAKGEMTVGSLATSIGLSEPTISHHLARLREAGLINLRMAGTQRFYIINAGGLEKFKQLAAQIENIELYTATEVIKMSTINLSGWDEKEQQALQKFLDNGKLTRLPAKRKKMAVILRWLASLFQPGKVYNESEVNDILKQVYETDYVSLRRYLIDFGFMRRENKGKTYWLSTDNPDMPGG